MSNLSSKDMNLPKREIDMNVREKWQHVNDAMDQGMRQIYRYQERCTLLNPLLLLFV